MLIEERLRNLVADERRFVEVRSADGGIATTHSYREVLAVARSLTEQLSLIQERPRVGVVMGNTVAFVATDLALLLSGAVEVPVPVAFSADQAQSLLEETLICLVDDVGAEQLKAWGDRVLPAGCRVVHVDYPALADCARPAGPDSWPATSPWDDEAAICKIVHTSGTTSRPKGVLIRGAGVDALVRSMNRVMPAGAYRRYLSLVPFSLLVEQVAALYLVIRDAGSTVLLPPGEALVGTSSSAAAAVTRFIAVTEPTGLVVTPGLAGQLAVLADRAAAEGRDPVRALFGRPQAPVIACGGAPVDPATLDRLDSHGIAVHEGYGLSENSSAVCWNVPGDRRNGTVGRPLDHVEVSLGSDGELLVRSTSLFAGYTRTDPSSCVVDDDGWLHTGDLAVIEDTGHIRIVGRKKNVIVTAAGRNVAPEWVEAQYATLPFVHATAVVGDGLESLHAVFLITDGIDPGQALARIAAFGAERLSVVERAAVAYVLPATEDLYREFFTVTGRPRRDLVRDALLAGRFPGVRLDDGTRREPLADAHPRS